MDQSDTDSEPLGVEFIPAFEDAKLRLDCFVATLALGPADFSTAMASARALYAWCMESEDSAQTDDAQLTGEDQCERKH